MRRLVCLAPLLAAACSEAPAPAAGTMTDAGAPPAIERMTAPAAMDVTIDDPRAFPESVTSLSDGTLIVGGTLGRLFRAGPGETVARTWIAATPENGLGSVLGVLGDEASGVVWLCSNPDLFTRGADGLAQVMAFDLATGEPAGAWPFPPNAAGAQGVCNDIAVAADGTLFAADTPGGRILTLAPGGAGGLTVYGEDALLVGIDGLAFADDGTLYVNNVQQHTIIRVDPGAGGAMGALTLLDLSQPVAGPDGMRPLGGARFLLGEGNSGRVSVVEVDGDSAQVRTLRDGLDGPVGVTSARGAAYAIEGQIGYRIDPAMRDRTPPPFIVHAIPLQSQNQPEGAAQ